MDATTTTNISSYSVTTVIMDMVASSLEEELYNNESVLEYTQLLPSWEDPLNLMNHTFETLSVMHVYPPTQEPTIRRLLITMYLIVCLTAGTCLNLSQVALQYYSFRLRIYKTTVSPNCTQLYICFNHFVYFIICLSLPSVIIEHLVKTWMFGIFACVSHLLLNAFGRTAAAWLTVMLFIDQLRVNPSVEANAIRFRKFVLQKLRIKVPKRKKAYYFSILFVLVICVVTCLPIVLYVHLSQEVLHEEYVSNFILRIRTFKCSSEIPADKAFPVTSMCFAIDFLLPLIVIIVSSINIYWRNKKLQSTIVYQTKLQNYRLLIAFLYIVAYLPHWIAVACVHIGVSAPIESKMLGDMAVLFPYTLPMIIWFPLSLLSTAASAQAKFYDIPLNANSKINHGNNDLESKIECLSTKRNGRWSSAELVSRIEINRPEMALQPFHVMALTATPLLLVDSKQKPERQQSMPIELETAEHDSLLSSFAK